MSRNKYNHLRKFMNEAYTEMIAKRRKAKLNKEWEKLIIPGTFSKKMKNLNFEKGIKDPTKIVTNLEKVGLIPALKGVHIQIYGVHTERIHEGHWGKMRTFWRPFFQKAGATSRGPQWPKH